MLPATAKRGKLGGGIPRVGERSTRGSKGRRTSPSLKHRAGRECLGRGSLGTTVSYLFPLLVLVGLLGPGVAQDKEEEYVDGGEVSMTCKNDDCSCSGSSEGGVSIDVFDYPASGGRIASVDNTYSEILETTCATSAVAAGDTLYTLSGVDLTDRELDVVSMSSADCPTVDIATPADCYSGETSLSLGGGVELDTTICFCKHVDDSTDIEYKSNVHFTFTYSGNDKVEVKSKELNICSEFDFISQMATFLVEDEPHYYNFQLDIPDEDTSSLSVASAPPSSAGAFLCGEEPTPSPVLEETTPPTEQPTPSLPAPTPSVATPSPVTPATPSPLSASPTPEPTVELETIEPSSSTPDLPVETSAPVSSSVAPTTPAPASVGSTPGPTPAVTAVEPSSTSTSTSTPVVPTAVSTVVPTVGSTVVSSGAPIGVVAVTVAPSVSGGGDDIPSNTTAPSSPDGSLSPAPSGVTPEPSPATLVADGQEDPVELNFEDRPLSIAGGGGVALAALGVLSVLTFLPTCVK